MVADCPTCGRPVAAKTIGGFQYHDSAEGPPARITLLVCPRCQHPILTREEEIWEDSWTKPQTVYPAQEDTINAALPEDVRSMAREARAAYRASAPTATAMMCRKILEAVCVRHDIREGNLAKALTRAKETGIIDGRLYDWADELRLAGNDAAHDVDSQVTGEDARDQLELTEAIVEHLFIYRDRFERFQQRRKARKQQGEPPASA